MLISELRQQATLRNHKMTTIKRSGDTELSQCTVCRAVVFTIDGITGGTANMLDCIASTIDVPSLQLTRPLQSEPDLGYSIGPDNSTVCPDCGRGTTIVGKSCYACGYRPSRPYTTDTIHAPLSILYYHTYETVQYTVTEHVHFIDDVKLRYSIRTQTRATVREPYGTNYTYVRTDRKRYTAPCGQTNVLRHVYVNDDDDDNPKFLYRFTCQCKCTKTR